MGEGVPFAPSRIVLQGNGLQQRASRTPRAAAASTPSHDVGAGLCPARPTLARPVIPSAARNLRGRLWQQSPSVQGSSRNTWLCIPAQYSNKACRLSSEKMWRLVSGSWQLTPGGRAGEVGTQNSQDNSLEMSTSAPDDSGLEDVFMMPLPVNVAALEQGPMPLMPREFLDCLVFLYPSASAAKDDRDFLAAGFFVHVKSKRCPVAGYIYIVTCAHVLDGLKKVCARINKPDGFATFETRTSLFVSDRKFDIAAVQLPIALGMKVAFVDTASCIEDWHGDDYKLWIGQGDEVFMVSRVVGQKIRYKTQNLPVMRFGNVALCPKHEEKAFVLEMRSIAGHSGSPVFVYSLPWQWSHLRGSHPNFGVKLLGINRGHLTHYDPVVRASDVLRGKTRASESTHVVATNMAMSQVIPAWKIVDLLNCDRFSKERDSMDERFTGNIMEDLGMLGPVTTKTRGTKVL